jgi:hypothetical protein
MLYESNQFFKKFSISDAAIAYQKPRSVILKYIKSGDLQPDYYKLIDYSQLVKVFGELSVPAKDDKEEQIKKLRAEVNYLRDQLKLLKKTIHHDEYHYSI